MTDLDECVADVQAIVDQAVAEMEHEIGRDLEDDEREALVDDILSELDDAEEPPSLFDEPERYAKAFKADGPGVDEVKRYAFNPNEPRESDGKWTTGGGSSKQSETAKEKHESGHAKEQLKSKYKIGKQKIDEGAVRTMRDKLGVKGLERAEDFLEFYGVQPEQQIDSVDVWVEGPQLQRPRVCFTAAGPWGRADRSIERNDDGELEITNRWIEMNHPGSGMATKMLIGEVRNAIDADVARIKCEAAGTAREERQLEERGKKHQALIGYRQWPKHGFDGAIPLEDENHPGGHFVRLPPEYRDAKTILDLFEMSGGPEWWSENGVGFDATFDLTPGSRSRMVLTDYITRKMLLLYGETKPMKFQK